MGRGYHGKWDKDELEKLYLEDEMSLQEIGDRFKVTRSRVQQVMHRLGIQRRKQYGTAHKNRLGRLTRYLTLNDYLLATARNNKSANFDSRTVKKYLPPVIQCRECSQSVLARKAHIHHIVYPATSVSDIQALCPSCHALKHKGKVIYANQISIYTEYTSGKTLEYLTKKYGVSYSTIMTVVKKIERGCSSLREATTPSPDKTNLRRKWRHSP